MPATPVWLASAEAVLNRSICASTRAGALTRQLNHKTLQVEIRGVTRVRAVAGAGRIALLRGDDSPADALISGSPAALFQLLTGGANRPGPRGSAQVSGDAEVAALYRELLILARPDLEEELARFAGDVPARRLARLARQAFSWARNAGRTAGENLAEYLQEESRDLVNRTELDEFLRGVDELRETADRVAARLTRLEQRLQSSP
jgi:ubiquinone biosynthesis protein UbiJ